MSGAADIMIDRGSVGPALRFLGQAGRDENAQLVFETFFRLSGSSDDRMRVEAARSLSAVSALVPRQLLVGVASQLARDSNLFVRVATARQIPALIPAASDPERKLLIGILSDCLRADGLSLPLAALRGIEELTGTDRSSALEPVRTDVSRLANDGPSDICREVAESLLGRL